MEVLGELTIEGVNFAAVATLVGLGGLPPVAVVPVSDRIIRVTVPDDPQLKAGARPVEVATQRATEIVEGGLGQATEATGQNVQTSNQGVFMLAPTVSTTSPASGTSAGLLTVTGKRLFDPEGRSLVIVGDVAIPVRRPGAGDPWSVPTESHVEVPLSASPSRSHPSRSALTRFASRKRRAVDRREDVQPDMTELMMTCQRRPRARTTPTRPRVGTASQPRPGPTGSWPTSNTVSAASARSSSDAPRDGRRSEDQASTRLSPAPLGDGRPPGPSGFELVSTLFGLSAFEEDVLGLCLSSEVDAAFPGVIAAAHGDAALAYPTPHLALDAFAACFADRLVARRSFLPGSPTDAFA